jgi:hypothetical protein
MMAARRHQATRPDHSKNAIRRTKYQLLHPEGRLQHITLMWRRK